MSTMESAATDEIGADATKDIGADTTGYADTTTGYADTTTGYADTTTGYADTTTGYGADTTTGTGADTTTGTGIQGDAEQQARPSGSPVTGLQPPETMRRHVIVPQVLGAVLIVAACVAGAMWYVPRVIAADGRLYTGTVSSTGVTNLNFAGSGLVGKVSVQLGQVVKTGMVLATETSPSTTASVSADRASIAAAQATLAELKASPVISTTQASIAAAAAQLAKGQAQLAADQVKLSETQIIAPSGGTVVAINGQTGETVTSAGIRSYSSSQSQTGNAQSPPFSLLPEGPAASLKTSASASALPMIALRTSTSWQVTVLVPESTISAVRPGQKVTIAVPAAGLKGIGGYIQQLSPTPVSTSAGTAYQVVVSIRGHQRTTPLSGMTADVQLSS
jgi:multidrug efflux pump subunit AcrA (membrane-fusion protein)